MLRCGNDPAKIFSGHSQARPIKPIMRLRIWRIGMGFTAPLRFLVRKSQKILGQMKPSIALPIWTVIELAMIKRH